MLPLCVGQVIRRRHRAWLDRNPIPFGTIGRYTVAENLDIVPLMKSFKHLWGTSATLLTWETVPICLSKTIIIGALGSLQIKNIIIISISLLKIGLSFICIDWIHFIEGYINCRVFKLLQWFWRWKCECYNLTDRHTYNKWWSENLTCTFSWCVPKTVFTSLLLSMKAGILYKYFL